jgi:beta-glucosidase
VVGVTSSAAPNAVKFPRNFLWGSATAAYQVEGSPLADGAGPSIWHRFVRRPGMVLNGDTGDVACDQYRLWKQDISLMQQLGMQAYRFSISWSRILPEGKGRVNEAGLDHYERLVDGLLAAGIEPLVTLYHWDLPAALNDLGGWVNRDVAEWFADYATIMYRRLDGRVKSWATLNEPWVVTDGGYLHGALAPGHKDAFETALASHNLLRSHGAAVKAYRAEGAHQVGLVVNIEPKYPASDSEEDAAAVRRAHAYMNRQYLDPVFFGKYPDEMSDIFGEAWPKFPASDFALIAQPIDWLGLNYYTRAVTAHDETNWPLKAKSVRQEGAIYSETGWEVYPQGLTDTLLWLKETYGELPLYVTENGSAFADPDEASGGKVEDTMRVEYLKAHVRACSDAIRKGVDLRGYMAWSLLDNLEWSLGYSKRFGIVHTNFATQERTLKDSGKFYAEIIRTNGDILNRP